MSSTPTAIVYPAENEHFKSDHIESAAQQGLAPDKARRCARFAGSR